MYVVRKNTVVLFWEEGEKTQRIEQSCEPSKNAVWKERPLADRRSWDAPETTTQVEERQTERQSSGTATRAEALAFTCCMIVQMSSAKRHVRGGGELVKLSHPGEQNRLDWGMKTQQELLGARVVLFVIGRWYIATPPHGKTENLKLGVSPHEALDFLSSTLASQAGCT